MVKLLICLFGTAAVSVCVLQLRQQQLELSYQNAELHEQIRSHQSRLWDQQLQIAGFTAPNAIANTVNSHELNLVPRQQPLTRPSGPATKPAASPAKKAGQPATPPRRGTASTPARDHG